MNCCEDFPRCNAIELLTFFVWVMIPAAVILGFIFGGVGPTQDAVRPILICWASAAAMPMVLPTCVPISGLIQQLRMVFESGEERQ